VTENQINLDYIRSNINTRLIGRDIIYYSSLPSTMDAAREALSEGKPDGTVIVASEQTAGRGRLKRLWLSPTGCLAVSVLLSPEKRFIPFLVMTSALAVLDTVESLVKCPAEIKWPNDVLISSKKVSGILVETIFKEGEAPRAIIGIGMNINMDALDGEISSSATSLSIEAGAHFPISTVLAELLNHLERRYDLLVSGEPIFEMWRQRLSTLGKSITVQTGNAVLQGTAVDVSHDGAMMLKMPDDRLQKIFAGDITPS
jgi:BirA family biotin operon repressor/biotin-[acetyl-CoA-carboxylase] ligase